MARILITGLTGFVGSHLADHLLSQEAGHQLFGTMRWRSRTENVDHLLSRLTLLECDLRDGTSVREAVASSRPDIVFHLAAQSNVSTSFHAPSDTVATNLIGQLNLLEALREQRFTDTTVLVPGSGEEYGMVLESELPLTEESDLRPLSPYAVSKAAQDMLAYQYARSYGMRIVRVRAFNHIGPRRSVDYAEGSFASQLAAMEKKGEAGDLRVGNLKAVRDFSDVRDIVRAYWLAVVHGQAGEVYNICSGQGRTVGDLLDLLVSLSTVKPHIIVDPARLRPKDPPVLVGDNRRFCALTGWTPQHALRDTLHDVLEYWRVRA